MKIRAMLDQYIGQNALCPGASSVDVWQSKKWFEASFNEKRYRILPMFLVRKPLMKHDIHHMLTGYDATPQGEFEIAAWELSSGGCSTHIVFWFDRIGAVLLGLILCRDRTIDAFRRGLRHKNIYSLNVEDVLESDLSDLRSQLNLDA